VVSFLITYLSAETAVSVNRHLSSWVRITVVYIIIIIIIIIIIVIVISFMQGTKTYIPETNHVPREQRVAAILVLLFMVLISLVPALTPL